MQIFLACIVRKRFVIGNYGSLDFIYIYNICSIVYFFYIQGEQSTVLKIIPYTKCGDNSLYKNKLKCRIKFFRLRLCVRGNQV